MDKGTSEVLFRTESVGRGVLGPPGMQTSAGKLGPPPGAGPGGSAGTPTSRSEPGRWGTRETGSSSPGTAGLSCRLPGSQGLAHTTCFKEREGGGGMWFLPGGAST